MKIGRMRYRITIQSPPATKNTFGEMTGSWTTFATVWASKEPLLGNEYFAAESAQSKVEVKFRIRYRSGVTNTMRVVEGSDTYDILSVVDVMGLKREMLIYAKKVV